MTTTTDPLARVRSLVLALVSVGSDHAAVSDSDIHRIAKEVFARMTPEEIRAASDAWVLDMAEEALR